MSGEYLCRKGAQEVRGAFFRCQVFLLSLLSFSLRSRLRIQKKYKELFYYKHELKTTCEFTDVDKLGKLKWHRAWERLAVSPKAGTMVASANKILRFSHYDAELIRPYMWVLRRFNVRFASRDGLNLAETACTSLCGGKFIESARQISADQTVTLGNAYLKLEQKVKAEQAAAAARPSLAGPQP